MENTRNLMAWPLFHQLLGFLWIVAFALYSLDQPLESSATRIVSFVNISWQFILWYNFCRLAENVTNQATKVIDNVYDIDWIVMSKEEKAALVFMMTRSKLNFYFTCLGVYDCSLEIFSTVIASVVTSLVEPSTIAPMNIFVVVSDTKKSRFILFVPA